MGRVKQPPHNPNQRILPDIAGSFAGRPIVVMGGAPCLKDDLEHVRSAGCWLSANQHGHLLHPADYLVCADLFHQITGRLMSDEMAEFDVPTISPYFWSDFRVTDHPQRFPMNSGILALYVAAALGGHPVIATGFEFFTGGTYHHDEKANTTGHRGLHFYLKMAMDLKQYAPFVHFRAVSGPLTHVFEPYGAPVPMRYEMPHWVRQMRSHPGMDVEWTSKTRRIYRQMPRPGGRYRLSWRESGENHRHFKRLVAPESKVVD